MTAATRRRFAALLACAAITGCSGPVELAPAPAGVLCHGFTLVDPGTERVVSDAFLLVDGGRIAAVGADHGMARLCCARSI